MTKPNFSALATSLLFLIPLAPCQASLIAHWTGDNTANDSSGNLHHGTLSGDTNYVTGVVGQAFSFDGNGDYVSVNPSASLEPSTISVTAWLKIPDQSRLRMVADSSHGSGKGWALQIRDTGSVSFAYGNGSAFPEVISVDTVDDDAFHHVAAVKDATTMTIYIDGMFDHSISYVGTAAASGLPVRIGSWLGGGRDLQGLVDDVRIYDNALSASEVSSLASAVPEPCSLLFFAFASVGIAIRQRRQQQVGNDRIRHS
ncbi:LamG domain-containing protein [Novipirellula artificiosorum]|uniref:Laminin G domain-containing protein n=1 Tax=Novipirellula artificiosorum TaxID=2528016 RepID=A0A5C6E2W8_9BACT|nr:LamG domain-containing protein [Novipirellula artificiosorum]TWU41961.1 hypothetical protein Poly41_02570 [Novipirellula artificiosorum]